MSDNEFNSNDELSLPRATVQKIVGEILASLSQQLSAQGETAPELSFARDARECFVAMCVEFIALVSAEANDIAEKSLKKTISPEHVVAALRSLEFDEYIPEVESVAVEHKEISKNREKKQKGWELSGLSEEELMRQQAELFGQSAQKFNQDA